MSYTDQKALAVDDAFISKVEIAATIAAIAIAGEDSATAGHTNRAAYANTVLAASRDRSRDLAHGTAADPAITASSSDATLSARISAIWNAYAGFNPN